MNDDEKALFELLEYCSKPLKTRLYKPDDIMVHPSEFEAIRKAMKLPKVEPGPLVLRPTKAMEVYWMVFEPSMLITCNDGETTDVFNE